MKTFLLAITYLLLYSGASFQEEYVCTPCGNNCDNAGYAEPGVCQSCGMERVKKSSIAFRNLTPDEFCHRLEANPNAILLDVRSYGEFNGSTENIPSFGHFKRAINIPVDELNSRMGELKKYKNHEILVYCSHNHRSPRASYQLGANGFQEVKNMIGGVSTFTTSPLQACLEREFIIHSH